MMNYTTCLRHSKKWNIDISNHDEKINNVNADNEGNQTITFNNIKLYIY